MEKLIQNRSKPKCKSLNDKTPRSEHSSDDIPTGVLDVKILVYFQAYFEKDHHHAKS